MDCNLQLRAKTAPPSFNYLDRYFIPATSHGRLAQSEDNAFCTFSLLCPPPSVRTLNKIKVCVWLGREEQLESGEEGREAAVKVVLGISPGQPAADTASPWLAELHGVGITHHLPFAMGWELLLGEREQ